MRSNDPTVFPCLKGGVHRWKADLRQPRGERLARAESWTVY